MLDLLTMLLLVKIVEKMDTWLAARNVPCDTESTAFIVHLISESLASRRMM